jgi:hypothetical protein
VLRHLKVLVVCADFTCLLFTSLADNKTSMFLHTD